MGVWLGGEKIKIVWLSLRDPVSNVAAKQLPVSPAARFLCRMSIALGAGQMIRGRETMVFCPVQTFLRP